MFERCKPLRQDSGLVENLQCAVVARDVQLVPGRTLECVLAVGADLGSDAEVA